MRTLLEFCERERDWLIDTATALVQHESPTPDKGAVDRCGRVLRRRLEAIGATVEMAASADTGDHLLATIGNGPTRVMLLGHFDTVWPLGQLDRMPLREEDGRLYGPGIFDMKAGIAIGMLAARALLTASRLGDRTLAMLFTGDEERGSGSSRELIEKEGRRADAVFVLEPSLPGGAVKTARKGCGEFELHIRGVPAHAGVEPGRGASAIDEMAAQITALGAIRGIRDGVSLNVGVVEGGGRPNVVAEHARAVIDTRVARQEDVHAVEDAIRGLRPTLDRTAIEVVGGFSRPPLVRTPAVVRLYERAREVAGELGRPLAEGGTGGGSDGNFTAALGVPTLDGLGAVGDGAHALNEHVETGELPWRAALLAGLIERFDAR
ncbi:MAG: M20 family metallopeptidase [Acidobacteria bacterium]|nr:M20 family metallopeptidase [Acidobacteriota bacterium]